jgi:hypothetical protein
MINFFNRNRTRLLLISAMLLSGCTHFLNPPAHYYYPSQQNVLRFKEKGDLQASIGLDDAAFRLLDVGYAITDNIAVVSAYQSSGYDELLWDNEIIWFKKRQNQMVHAVNAGFGFGKTDMAYADLHMNRQFLQPSYGYFGRHWEVAVSARFSRVQHRTDPYYYELYWHEELKDVSKKTFFFMEPALTAGIGPDFLKLRYQVSMAEDLTNHRIKTKDVNHSLSLNLVLNVNKMFRKQ